MRRALRAVRVARAAAVLACTVAMVAACASRTSAPSLASSAHLLRASNPRVTVPASTAAELGAAVRAFGYGLDQRLQPSAPSGNLVYSPASLAIDLAMLREGAVGSSATQLDSVVHLPADRQQAFDALLADLADPGAGNTLSLGDAVFVEHGVPVRPAFLDALARWYGAGAYQTSFPQPGLDAVNAYVAQQTHGRIPHLLGDLDPTTLVVLVNTVFMNAKWMVPFDGASTDSQPFTTSGGSRVQVMMMHNNDFSFAVADGAGWSAVRIPYRDGRLSMWILLPTGLRANPARLLSPAVLAKASASFASTPLNLSLPRFSIDSRPDVTAALKSMGLQAPFHGGLSGISGAGGLFLSQIVHESTIEVGERGTVASAATADIVEGISASPVLPLTFDVNHPFAFAIMDTASGVPLFEGTVSNPGASSPTGG